MDSTPDILVTDPSGMNPEVVIEVKTGARFAEGEGQLKRYMAGMRCPVGVLVSEKRLQVFVDRYVGAPEQSIQLVAESSIPESLRRAWFSAQGADDKRRGALFEAAVQHWLEQLAAHTELRELDARIRDALKEYVLPALESGAVRAGFLRESDRI